jgi:hypothetical protein
MRAESNPAPSDTLGIERSDPITRRIDGQIGNYCFNAARRVGLADQSSLAIHRGAGGIVSACRRAELLTPDS